MHETPEKDAFDDCTGVVTVFHLLPLRVSTSGVSGPSPFW
jgi:hypothetical protein